MLVKSLLAERKHQVALLSGLIFPFAIAPFLIWPLAIASLVGLLYSLDGATAKQAFFRTWLFGTAKFLIGVSWIYVSMHDHGGTPAILAGLMILVFAAFLATFPAIFMYGFQRWFNQPQHNHWLAALSFGLCWFLYEWFRSWFMTGFPWLFAGDSHLETWLNGFAPVISVYGLSVLTALMASAIFYGYKHRQPAYAAVLLIWPLGLWLQGQQWTQQSGDLKVAAVQGNIAQEIKWNPDQRGPTISAYLNQTRQNWDADLVLWPETAVTILKDQFQAYLDGISEEAQKNSSALITGIPYRYTEGPFKGEFHNSIVAVGNGDGLYHKQKLVPFGEYVPLADAIRGLLPFFDLPMSSFKKGEADQELLKVDKNDQLFLIAPFICYEIVYPELVADMAKEADLLITVSNDAWFGDSLGPKQHMAIARMRALETQRYVLRSTNTGITALVNNHGEMVTSLPTKIRATLKGDAKTFTGQTPFMKFGLMPLLIFSFVMLAIGLLINRKAKKTVRADAQNT